MSDVIHGFQKDLNHLAVKLADRPHDEMVALFMLALEREELVAVSYRESLMRRRLAEFDLDPEIRELIRSALIWIWKDEEMHTIYIRGAILELGGPLLRAKVLVTQFAGCLGGWAGSTLQHTRWRQTPLSRGLATLITLVGALFGKVPRDVADKLRYGPFRNFCLFNVQAEETARLAWARVVTLGEQLGTLPAHHMAAFRRIVDDEVRHQNVFRLLAEMLDERDQALPGTTAAWLAERIRQVDVAFLPFSWRNREADHPIGKGGDVWCLEAGSDLDGTALFRQTLRDSGLAEQLVARAAVLGKPVSQLRVVLKPAFMMGYHRRDLSPIIEPRLIIELARFLHEQGCPKITVIEGRNIYSDFFHNREVAEVARYFGIESPHFDLVDASLDQVEHNYPRGLGIGTISRGWRDADFRISFGKLRSHASEQLLGTVANLEGIGMRWDHFIFLERHAAYATVNMMILDDLPPNFALLDAFSKTPDGLVGVMGRPWAPSPRRFYAGVDALAVDVVAGRHAGAELTRDSSIMKAALFWFGSPDEAVTVRGCDRPLSDWCGPYSNEVCTLFSLLSLPVYEYSGRGQFFVPQMDGDAFPPRDMPGPFLRLGRWIVQTLFGLRLTRERES